MKRILLIIITASIIIGGVALIKKRRQEMGQTPVPNRPIACFYVQSIDYGTMPIMEHYSGTIFAEETVNLASQLQGRIVAVHRNEGDTFLKDDILIQLDDGEILRQITSMDAEINRTESEFWLRQTIYERKKTLVKDNAVSQESTDEAYAAYTQSRDRLESIKAQLAALKIRLSYTEIKAPFNGVVTRKMLEPGDMAMPGNTILKVENPDKGYKVLVHIPVGLTTSIFKGTPALLVFQGDTMKADVSKVLPSLNDGTNLGIIEIFIKNRPYGLPSGSSLGVDLTVAQPKGFIIPERAVLSQNKASHVYVLGPDNTVNPISIRVLGWAGTHAVVSGKLHEKDKVVVADESRLLGIGPGERITPLPEEKMP